MDEQDWVRAGLYDATDATDPVAADRLGLLRYLDSLGCSLDEMVEADREGRLFALSGDRLITPPGRRWTVAEAAAEVGLDEAGLSRLWRAFGLPAPVDGLLTDRDVEGLSFAGALAGFLGPDAALGMARVMGSSIARIAEAGSSAMRSGFSEVALGISGSEEATARAYASIAALVPGIATLMDAVYRHHLVSARKHFEAVEGDTFGLTVRCGVGFADLSGFTTVARQLELAELSKLLVVFEDLASEVVHSGGGRVVKFLGDAVMFVAPEASRLAAIARDLVLHPTAAEAGVSVRSGIGHGQVLAQDGDYFGTPVNVAARLTDVAEPGQLLVDEAVAKALASDPGFSLGEAEHRALRGFPEPMPSWELLLR